MTGEPTAGARVLVVDDRPADVRRFDELRARLPEHGCGGLTTVGDTPTDPWDRYVRSERILEEARLALWERPLPG